MKMVAVRKDLCALCDSVANSRQTLNAGAVTLIARINANSICIQQKQTKITKNHPRFPASFPPFSSVNHYGKRQTPELTLEILTQRRKGAKA